MVPEVGETEREKSAAVLEPVPVRLTVCGLPVALSVTLKLPVGVGDADRELECYGQCHREPADGEPDGYRLKHCGGFLPLRLPNFRNHYRRSVGQDRKSVM